MIGNPVDYDKKFIDCFPIFPAKLDFELRRYLNLIPGKEVLDLGIGQGRNSIPLANLGFNVTGVDYSTKCLDICRNNSSKLNLVRSDVRDFEIERNKYDLILSSYVLHFLHKDDSYKIMQSMKENLNPDGLIYIQVFSTKDPKFNKNTLSHDFELLDNNIFHNLSNDTYISFFTKEEILEIFRDLKTIYISEEYSLELSNQEPHYAGVVKYIGKKTNKVSV